MGCCISKTTPKAPPSDTHHSTGPSRRHYFPGNPSAPEPLKENVGNTSSNYPPPPPPPLEEETVKEVLSETPIPKPSTLLETQRKKTQMTMLHPEPIQPKCQPKAEEEVSEASQITEVYSVSESISMATTISENKEDDEATSKRGREVGQRVKSKVPRKHPYASQLASRREQREKRLAKRVEPPPPPAKKSEVVGRPLNVRGTCETMTRNRRDSDDGSGRRSRSPASRTAGGASKGGSGPSTGKMPGRFGGGGQSHCVESNSGKVEEPKPNNGGRFSSVQTASVKMEEQNDGDVQPVNESLENPLVSLECFIFL